MKKFKIKSNFEPAGDQPQAIKLLSEGVNNHIDDQVLLGVTGSGKTFSLAKVIENVQMPTLIISHNKTLSAQLYQEFRDFFPDNGVSFFVSYYDYYQPEAYIPQTDTYIEKETEINEEIDKLRLSTTANLLSRPDVIVVASVSCIYNLGSPIAYKKFLLKLTEGQVIDRMTVISRLVDLQYGRQREKLERGDFRVRGNLIDLWPAYEDIVIRLKFDEKTLYSLEWLDPINFTEIKAPKYFFENNKVTIYPAKHFIAPEKNQDEVFSQIRDDLSQQVKRLQDSGLELEANRLEQRVNYDLDMIAEMGYVSGIENYSRYFDGRKPGEPPYTLLDYMKYNADKFNKKGFMTIVDESHMTVPQIKGMHKGDKSRKETLINHGFRLPAARDNRPLDFDEFRARTENSIFVSATPSTWEKSMATKAAMKFDHPGVVEQLVRPTGLLEPEIDVRPIENQVSDLIGEVLSRMEKGERVLVTTLTKKMAEDLAEYLANPEKIKSKIDRVIDRPIKVEYLHSDVDTLDRSDILDELRGGDIDVIVGINLLREGLDLPEVSLVAILDADKEGFLRSKTSLVQTMGRAARNKAGQVILYADEVTRSMRKAVDEINRRREIQEEFNRKHKIEPKTIRKPIREKLLKRDRRVESDANEILMEFGWSNFEDINPDALTPKDRKKVYKEVRTVMNKAAKDWNFEKAAELKKIVNLLES